MSIRVGMVGVGGIAEVHLNNVSRNEQAELVAVCDIVAEQAEKKGERYGAVPYTDFEAMLDNEKPDVVFICVPPFAHGDLEEQAARRGIHLFVEKPLGLDMDIVKKKAAYIEEAGVMTSTGYCLRYLDTVRRAKEYLADKEIGMVRGYYLTGFVSTPWWREMAKSGGQLVEQSTHTVDMVRYLAGDVSKVYASMALRLMSDIEGLTIPDVGVVNLEFESGAVGLIETTFIQQEHRSGVEILGKGFRVWVDGTNLTIIEGNHTVTDKSSVDFYKQQDDAFIEAIRSNNRELILAPYGDALKTLEVTLAANESASTGLPVITK